MVRISGNRDLESGDHHPLVMDELLSRISLKGRVTFAEFMEIALYLPGFGYYRSAQRRPCRDYRTSPQVHSAFGTLLALQLEQMWRVLDRPGIFTVLEVGSGNGRLGTGIVRGACRIDADFGHALQLVAIEMSPEGLLGDAEVGGCVRIIAGSALALPAGGVIGCVVANELIDAFPVHRVIVRDGRLCESYVTASDGGLVEIIGEPSTPELASYFERIGLLPKDGCLVEVNLAAARYIREVANALSRGFSLVVDYGFSAEDLYLLSQPFGTLRCFSRQRCHGDPLKAIGRQDITSHVDYSSLVMAGREVGLHLSGLATQRDFLLNLGWQAFADQFDRLELTEAERYENRRAMQELVSNAGLGSFRVLAQHKGVHDPELDGFYPCNGRKRALLTGRLSLEVPLV